MHLGFQKIMMHQKNEKVMRWTLISLFSLFISSCGLFHSSSKETAGLSCNGLHSRNVGAEKLLADDSKAKNMPKYKMDKSLKLDQ